MTDEPEAEETQPPKEADYYTMLCALIVRTDRYLGCKVKEKIKSRAALHSCLARIYEVHPELFQMVQRAKNELEARAMRKKNGIAE